MEYLFMENAASFRHWVYKRTHVFLERPQMTENTKENLRLDFKI